MLILEIALWLSLAFAVHVYFVYPAILWAYSRIRPRAIRRGEIHPTVSFVIPVHNEESVIEEKVRNSLESRYPADRLEVIVVSDGSTDRTSSIVGALEDRRVRLIALERVGKALALNEAVHRAKGDVLVFSDANSMLERESLAHLISSFADPEVGGVCGNQKYRTSTGSDSTEQGENLYWRFDKWLKSLESRTGSIFAADGSLYAVRRELYVPIEDPCQADDIAISARVVLQGYRLVFEPHAVAYEDPPVEGRRELERKIRVTNHSVRALLKLGKALWTSGFYSFELVSHKLFRHFVPFALVVLLAANVALADERIVYGISLSLQVLFYGLALCGFVLRGSRLGKQKLFSVPYFFSLANTAALFGILALMGGRRIAAWNPRTGLASMLVLMALASLGSR